MKNTYKIGLQISILTFFSSLLFLVVLVFWYADIHTVKEFFEFFEKQDIFLLLFIGIFSGVIGFISHFFVEGIFKKIEQNNQKLKDYNHFVAHELKTPIAVVQSNLEILTYGFDEKKIGESKQELGNMVQIINRLLQFSESVSAIDKQEVNVENFIKKCISFTEYGDNISIVNNEFNFSIVTDEVLFERIVQNLIDNAMKYAPDQKLTITILTDKLVFENLMYKDISSEEIQKLQEKFYSKSCNENTGCGLGLALIADIAKVLGYSLEINVSSGKFCVTLVY